MFVRCRIFRLSKATNVWWFWGAKALDGIDRQFSHISMFPGTHMNWNIGDWITHHWPPIILGYLEKFRNKSMPVGWNCTNRGASNYLPINYSCVWVWQPQWWHFMHRQLFYYFWMEGKGINRILSFTQHWPNPFSSLAYFSLIVPISNTIIVRLASSFGQFLHLTSKNLHLVLPYLFAH